MAYQAGTAFVRVVPDLTGFQSTIRRDLRQIRDMSVRVRIDVDHSGISSAVQAARGLQSVLSRLAVPAALLTAAPHIAALASTLASAAGAALLLPAALGAAAAAVGTLMLGFSGLGDALKSVSKAEKTAAKDASAGAQARVAAARRVRSAKEALASAERQAARDAAQSAKRVTDAERDLTRAQQRARDAQRDLTQARAEAREELEDLQLSLRGTALDEEQAVIDLAKAQEELAAARKAGVGGRDLAELDIAARQAQLRLDEIRERYGDLKAEGQEWARTGIEGSEGVQAAARNVAEAQQGVRDAEMAVTEARQEAAYQAQESARAIASAQADLAEATAAAASAGRQQSAAMQAASDAMANLSPNARNLVNTLLALRPAWDGLRMDVQDRLLAGVGTRISDLATNYIPILKSSLGGIAGAFNRAFHTTAAWFNEPAVVREVAAAMDLVSLGVQNAAGAIKPLVQAFTDIFVVGASFLPGMGTSLANAAQRFADFIREAKQSGQLRQWMQDGLDALRTLWTIVKRVASAIKAWWDVLGPVVRLLAPFAGAILGAMVAVKLLLGVFRTLSTIFTTVRVALAVFGGPVTIAIAAIFLLVGAVIYAWQNFEWFRDIVKAVWQGICVAAQWAWDNVLKPIWDAMVWVFHEYIAPAALWLWNEVFVPVFQGIGRIVQSIWVNVLKPVFDTLWWVIREYIAPTVVWLFQNVVDPMFRGIGTVIKWVWDYVVKPVFDLLVWMIADVLAPTFKWLWVNIVDPAFRGIGAVVEWVWLHVIKPAWDAVVGGLDWLGENFDRVVGWIGDIWNGLRNLLAKPINFLIETVWNNGIRKAWNLVANLLPGIDPVEPLDKIPEYARGGPITGGTPGKDSVLAKLMPGEYVLPTRMARSIGYDNLDRARAAALQGRGISTEGMLAIPGYSQGGMVEQAKRWAQSQDGKPYQWGGVGNPSWDCSGFMSGIQNVLMGRSPNRRLYTTSSFGPNRGAAGLVPGLSSAFTVGVQRGHMAGTLDGVNVESSGGAGVRYGRGARGSTSFPWHFSLPSAGGEFVDGGGGGGFWSWLSNLLGQITSIFETPMRALVNSIPWDAPPRFFGLPKKLGHNIIDNAVAWFKGTAESSGGTPGTGPVADQVRSVANTFGWGSGAQWDALSRLIQKESSWNPLAQNPRSSAFGLFQFLDSTWGTVGGHRTDNPGLQAQFGLRYIQRRYGDPLGALNFHNRNNWYDEGGWLPPGLSTVYNGTGKPEPVLTRHQLDELTSAATGGGSLIGRYEQHFHGQERTEDALDSLTHRLRVAQRSR